MRKVGLFLGSFNPIHNGHLMVANYALEHGALDEVWFVLAMQNPQKDNKDLLPFRDRCAMIEIAIETYKHKDDTPFHLCCVEKEIAPPYYTYKTLDVLKSIYDDVEYSLILGADAFFNLYTWYNRYAILSTDMIVIPRLSTNGESYEGLIEQLNDTKNAYRNDTTHVIGNITILENAPLSTLSSTFVRNEVKAGKNVDLYVPPQITQLLNYKKDV